jgi:hypothetical protein
MDTRTLCAGASAEAIAALQAAGATATTVKALDALFATFPAASRQISEWVDALAVDLGSAAASHPVQPQLEAEKGRELEGYEDGPATKRARVAPVAPASNFCCLKPFNSSSSHLCAFSFASRRPDLVHLVHSPLHAHGSRLTLDSLSRLVYAILSAVGHAHPDDRPLEPSLTRASCLLQLAPSLWLRLPLVERYRCSSARLG